MQANYLLETGQDKQALEVLSWLLDQDPKKSEYLTAYGRAKEKLGDLDEAMAIYRRSLLNKANQPWLRRDLIRLTKENAAKLTSRVSYTDQSRTTKFRRSELGVMGPVGHGLKIGARWNYDQVEREDQEFADPAVRDSQRVMAFVQYKATPRLTLGVSAGPVMQGPRYPGL